MTGAGPKILLVVGGGIAAYKSCELVRLIRKGGGDVTCVLTAGGQQFVTPMALAALSENQVHTTLWNLKNEAEMGHIQLSREADLVVVCPATADLMAKMAAGIADDLATTLILATDKPVMAVPAMNVRMWEHEATQRNLAWLRQAGVKVLDPDEGAMACGEFGYGRLPEPEVIWAEIAGHFGIEVELPESKSARRTAAEPDEGEEFDEALEPEAAPKGGGLGGLLASIIPRSTPKRSAEEIEAEFLEEGEAIEPQDVVADEKDALAGAAFEVARGHRPLKGKHVLVTAGSTWEAIDPVRYIANRSSGKQGFTIAAAAAALGAKVTLVSGPVALKTPEGVARVDVESAQQMNDAVKTALPADIAVMVAAVADWRPKEYEPEKMKKRGSAPPVLVLTENPDILTNVAAASDRPSLVVGFAAETEDVIENAKKKRKRKAADWIVANDVSGNVMGGDTNRVHIVSDDGVESLVEMPKLEVAMALVQRMADALKAKQADG